MNTKLLLVAAVAASLTNSQPGHAVTLTAAIEGVCVGGIPGYDCDEPKTRPPP